VVGGRVPRQPESCRIEGPIACRPWPLVIAGAWYCESSAFDVFQPHAENRSFRGSGAHHGAGPRRPRTAFRSAASRLLGSLCCRWDRCGRLAAWPVTGSSARAVGACNQSPGPAALRALLAIPRMRVAYSHVPGALFQARLPIESPAALSLDLDILSGATSWNSNHDLKPLSSAAL